MLKIYAVDIENGFDDTTLSLFLNICESEKKNRIINMKNKRASELSLAANALAKFAIKNTFSIPIKEQIFVVGQHGKPFLKNTNNVHFSVSHSGNMAVCAVSNCKIGVDIQKITRFSKKTADFIGLPSDCKTDEFFKAWTQLEASAKRTGEPLISFVKSVSAPSPQTFSIKYKNYYISVSR